MYVFVGKKTAQAPNGYNPEHEADEVSTDPLFTNACDSGSTAD